MSFDNIKLFFQPAYLFNPYPGYQMKFLIPLLVFFGILIILSLVFLLISRYKKKNKPLSKFIAGLHNWFLWTGVVGLVLLFLRYENIPYISSRLILFLWLATFVFWGIYNLFFGYNKYRKTIKEFKEEQAKKKYFRKK